jgi:hypothetical protein
MTVHLPLLLLALLLLWFPRQWLRLGSVLIKRRSRSAGKSQTSQEPWNTREPGDLSVDFLTEFSKFRNYVDLIRATAGSVCVIGGLHVEPCLQLADNATSGQTTGLLVLKSLILLVALLIQTIRYEHRRFTFYPPIFFLGGLSVVLCEPFGALFAFILIWAFNPVVRNAQGFLTLYAILMVAFGMYFSGLGDKTSMFAGFLCFLPVLLSLLAQRPLVIFARKGRHSTTASTP